MEGLKQLDDESVDLIITSPPYNKTGFNNYSVNGKRKGDIWSKAIMYGGNANLDNMPEEEYEKWQIDFLNDAGDSSGLIQIVNRRIIAFVFEQNYADKTVPIAGFFNSLYIV